MDAGGRALKFGEYRNDATLQDSYATEHSFKATGKSARNGATYRTKSKAAGAKVMTIQSIKSRALASGERTADFRYRLRELRRLAWSHNLVL